MAQILHRGSDKKIIMMHQDENMTNIVQIGQIDLREEDDFKPVNVEDLPLLPTRNLVMFPKVHIPLTLTRAKAIEIAEYAMKNKISLGIVCQISSDTENPTLKDLYNYGVVVDVLQIVPLPDGQKAALIRAKDKFRIDKAGMGQAIPSALSAQVSIVKDRKAAINDAFDAILTAILDTSSKVMKHNTQEGVGDFMFSLQNIEDPELLINMVSTNMPLPTEVKVQLLSMQRLRTRAERLLEELFKIEELMNVTHSIKEKAQRSLNDQNRNVFLQQQMEAIREELYGEDDDAQNFLKKAKDIAFPDNVRKTFEKEVEKLRRLNPQSPDYSIQYSFLDTILELPWNVYSEPNKDVEKAEEILNEDHYGLEKVKERVLEQIALMVQNPTGNAPIICLVGAPGVGKTSLGISIAKALGREYQRISLGGLHDEAELRGHRRTYIGALPGRVIDAMRRCNKANPVLLLDEIDKIGADIKGDPAAALLEVLDPEQNCHFHDNYIDVDFDLSKVLFIATANTLSTISQPLLDRMEVIEIPGYLLEEKIEIAKRHLIPRQLEFAGLQKDTISFSSEALRMMIESYTAESGVRQLEKAIASVIRKVILKHLRKNEQVPHTEINTTDVNEYLGVIRYTKDRYEGNDFAGVVAGLAWTSVGGEILFIESSLAPGKGERPTLTGNLGDVMKESAVIAWQYVKAHAQLFGIGSELFDKYNLHIHVPEGAIPKDGPSAGITMVTSIVSAYTQKKVKKGIAMTGEITLRGKVLPVGGIREKILAAKRAGLCEIILSEENRKDILDIPEKYVDGLTFHYVKTIREVIEIALTDELADDAMTL